MAGIERKLSRYAPLTEEQLIIATTARTFATWRLAPTAARRDRDGEFPSEELHALGDLGLLAMKVPIEEGGAGADNIGYALAMEAIAESCASTAVVLASSNLAAKILSSHGSPEHKQRWLRPYVEGKRGCASFALSEPGCGSDAAALTTSARWANDGWVISGSKMWITSGAHAGFHLVFARTDGPGRDGISCFIVERGTPGLAIGKEEDKMGQRASGTVALHFDDCRIPADNLIGKRGAGYAVALSALGAGRIGSRRCRSGSPRQRWPPASRTPSNARRSVTPSSTSRTRSSSLPTVEPSSTPPGC
jgi:alkylation response protein AidB-like acyl-CoA dehydrogenase